MKKNRQVANQILAIRQRGKKKPITKSMAVWDLGRNPCFTSFDFWITQYQTWTWEASFEWTQLDRIMDEVRHRDYAFPYFEFISTPKSPNPFHTLFDTFNSDSRPVRRRVVNEQGEEVEPEVYEHTFTPQRFRGHEFGVFEMDEASHFIAQEEEEQE